jgi:exodeoxyribonuclease VIII
MKAEPPLSVVDAVRQNSCNEKLKTDTGTNAGGEVITDRQNITSHTLDVLDIEIAAALLPMDFNIYEFPGGVLRRAKEVIREKEEPWKSWSSVLRKTAGVLDFSRAAIFVLIRNAPEDIHEEIPELIGYVSRNLVEVAFVPDTGIDDSETRWNALQKLFIRSDTGEASPETPAEPAAEGELVKVAAGVFDASSLFTAATKTDTADAGQPAETAENVQMEENHGDETEADIEVQMGETADVPAECGADVNHPSEALNNDPGHQITRDESSRLFTHLMIDIETMGKKPGAPVVSIGAVFFAPDTGETGAEFYQVISLESCMSFGAVPDASTILWWLKQSAEARSEILVDDAVGLVEALEMFDSFIADNAANGSRKVQLWGNGSSFDCSLIETAFELADIPFPIERWNYRDVRTVVEMGKAVGINPRYEIPFEGDLHHALDDARHQVKYVSKIWQVLTQI